MLESLRSHVPLDCAIAFFRIVDMSQGRASSDTRSLYGFHSPIAHARPSLSCQHSVIVPPELSFPGVDKESASSLCRVPLEVAHLSSSTTCLFIGYRLNKYNDDMLGRSRCLCTVCSILRCHSIASVFVSRKVCCECLIMSIGCL